MKQVTNFNRRLTMLFIAICAMFTFASAKETPPATQVYHIQNFFSEAYLVKGATEKLVLIETGVPLPGYGDSLIASIEQLGFKPGNISLIIVTHGHGDHAGNARFLQEKYHIPIAGSAADMDKFSKGKSELSKSESIGVWGDRLRSVSDLDYPPFTPDIIIDKNELDISKYGVNGKIIPMAGHTPGSIIVLLGKHLFVGDLFCGTFKPQGQMLMPDGHHMREHFFHENLTAVHDNFKSLNNLIDAHKVETLYPIHFGPVSANEVKKYIKEMPLLNELSALQTKVLNEIAQKKSGLVKKYMHDDAVITSFQGMQLTKDMFIKGFIENPAVQIESVAAEDFRITYADDNTAIMTYRENLKFPGNPAFAILVTLSYAKQAGSWKVVAVHTTLVQ